MDTKNKPLLSIDLKGVEVRVVFQEDSAWNYSVQHRVSRKVWAQVDAFTTAHDAFKHAVSYTENACLFRK